MMYDAMRCAGRIAFPVFAFLIAEGFAYTITERVLCTAPVICHIE
jgi:hypothetical protein